MKGDTKYSLLTFCHTAAGHGCMKSEYYLVFESDMHSADYQITSITKFK